MSTIEAEFCTIEDDRSWQQVFATIRTLSMQHDFSTKEAKRAENRNLNRYRDVSPYDHSRVVLHRSDVDYINASVVPVKNAGREYILTQGPLAATLPHFWLMVWEKNTKGIVMLNKLIEKNAVKCHQYWPDVEKREMVFESVDLRVSFVAESAKENYICRTFRLHDTKTDTTRDVLQFHYVNWPDFGVPQSPYDFLDFLDDVRRSGCLNADVGPAVVHCSAGIGRSGTFCVVDSILKMVEENRDESDIKLQDVLIEMRRFRMSLIQTAEQLRFSYLAIIEALRRRNNRSPYLSRRGGDEDAPPRPPHRAINGSRAAAVPITVVNRTADSSSDDDPDDDDKNESSPIAESSESRDSAVSSEMSSADEDSEGAPPPLPPRDIPATDSLISPEDSPSRSERQHTRLGDEQGQHEETQQTPTRRTASDVPQLDDRRAGEAPGEDSSKTAAPGHSEPRIIEELQSFEQEILSKETMQQPNRVDVNKGGGTGASDDGTKSNANQIEQQERGDTSQEQSTELRQRRLQRDQKIKEKIQAIKKGIAESEAAHKRRGVLGRIGVGFVVLMGTGILVYRMYNYWHS